MMKTIWIPVLMLALCGSACNEQSTKPVDKPAVTNESAPRKLVKIRGEYGLLLPDFMTRTDGMNKDASLQYWSILKRVYIVVIDESRDTLMAQMKSAGVWKEERGMAANLAELQMNNPAAGYSMSNYTLAPADFNGTPAMTAEANAHAEGVVQGFHYYFGFADGGNNGKVYTIMSWVYQKDTVENARLCRDMVSSFRLLNTAEHG